MAKQISERKKGVLMKAESLESRWVFEDQCDAEEDHGNFPNQVGFDAGYEEGDENEEHHLVRTGPMIDSLDVEALEISGVRRKEYEDFSLGKKCILALQTLGVVFGDVGTSPLYTFTVMFNNVPIAGEEDVLGALSLVLYTLILIPLIKYVLIVLLANDDGEGGTFALYSLICRHADASLLPNQLPSDAHTSIFRLKVPSSELERSLKVKECLEASLKLKRLLLTLVLFGTSMIIANAAVTPAMSVMSAVTGLKVGISGFEQDRVVMVSVSFLVILFSAQKYGIGKLGLVVGPALFIWFCSLAVVGIYNLIKYDKSVLRAFNPVHIYYFFQRNSTNAWLSLGGCLLCVTGSEAMFADICYITVRPVQLTFVFLVLPCLLLGYLGQAAFLMKNLNKADQLFFTSIPKGAFWPVLLIANVAALIASRAMTSATFSCLKKSMALGCFPNLKIIHTSRKFMSEIYIPIINWLLLIVCTVFVLIFSSVAELGNAYGIAEIGVMMVTTILVTIIMLLVWQVNIIVVLSFLILFLGTELVFFSSLLWSVRDGSWVIFVFAAFVFMVMSIWNYGTMLKYESEVKKKLSQDLLLKLGCNLGTIRAPGIGLVYNELVKGIPAIFGQFLTALPAIHSMIIFVCIKYVPVPVVPQEERFLFRRVCPRSYHIFRCIARYGYKDVRKENHQTFQQLLMESLEKFIRREVVERSLESDDDNDSDPESKRVHSQLVVASSGSLYSLEVPLLLGSNNGKSKEPAVSGDIAGSVPVVDPELSEVEESLKRELFFIDQAKKSGVVHLLGDVDVRAKKDSWFFKKLAVNYFYSFLRKNCRKGIANVNVPHNNLMQVSMTHMV